MNWLGFIKLINSIYGSGMPDPVAIQKMGLLAVKIGQVHALRIDFLSREKCEVLATLYRQNQTLPPADFFKLIDSAGGPGFRDNFNSIDERPLAAASIGQIHRAKMKDNSEVVIKAIKARYKAQFTSDVRSVEKLFKVLIFFYPKLARVANPLGILEDIKTYTLSELDLGNELKGQLLLKSIYEKYRNNYDLSRLAFARIYENISNEDVMVSEYIPGKTFDELLTEKKIDYQTLLDLFLVHGTYMFVAGTFHGDIHPGNVILSRNKFYFVDTGSTAVVSDKLRKGLLNFFEALSYDDYHLCAKGLHEMSDVELSEKKYKIFLDKFIVLYKDYKGSTVSQVSLTQKMMETIKLGVNNGMSFDKGMFPIIRSLMYMDGMVLKCNPDAVLLKDMQPYISQFKKQI
jgi:ubiquinone biosynthesis protein